MPKYRVFFADTRIRTSYIDIDGASCEEEARDLAYDVHPEGEVLLEPDDGSFEITHVEVVK
ncbi:MAG: hypothetical protein ACYTFG_16605 [Planctomycetota bacterium]|jgi:hypothetical protein